MKCPNCNFVCSDLRDICPKCIFDLRGYKKAVGLPISYPKMSYAELALKTTSAGAKRKKKNPIEKKEPAQVLVAEPIVAKLKSFFKKRVIEKTTAPAAPPSQASKSPSLTPPPPVPTETISAVSDNQVQAVTEEATPIVPSDAVFDVSRYEVPPSPTPAPLDLSDPEMLQQFLNDTSEEAHILEYVPGEPRAVIDAPSLSQEFSLEFDFEAGEEAASEATSHEEAVDNDIGIPSYRALDEPSFSQLRAGLTRGDVRPVVNEGFIDTHPSEPSLAALRSGLLPSETASSPPDVASPTIRPIESSLSTLFDSAFTSLPSDQGDFEVSLAQFYRSENIPEISILFDLADAALEDPETLRRYQDDIYSHHSGQIESPELQHHLKTTQAKMEEMGPAWRRDSTEKVSEILMLPRFRPATFLRRLGSGFVDFLLTAVLSAGVTMLLITVLDKNFHLFPEASFHPAYPEIVFFIGVWLAVLPIVATIYFILSHLSFGLTLGEVTAGIRVTTNDGFTPKWSRIVSRDILYPLSALMTLVIFPLIFFRSLADKWAKTRLSVLED